MIFIMSQKIYILNKCFSSKLSILQRINEYRIHQIILNDILYIHVCIYMYMYVCVLSQQTCPKHMYIPLI